MNTFAPAEDLPTTDPSQRDRLAELCFIAVGVALTLIVGGYQFGFGNHTVYLLDAVRRSDPQVLQNDWFTTSTLQYHVIFTAFTSLMMRLGVVEPVFLVGHVLLVVLWHLAWRAWSRAMGLSRETYLLSVMLYLISAGGISIGVYRFMQDSCFLPSNIANIAMLWGFYFSCRHRRLASAICLGVAGLFHINHAAAVCIIWGLLVLWETKPFKDLRHYPARLFTAPNVVTTLIAVVPSLLNVGNALRQEARGHSGDIPMNDFIDIYVHIRHAHHFDPLSWPAAMWISFLWPMPLAAIALYRAIKAEPDPRKKYLFVQTARLCGILTLLWLISFVFAGIWFVSETLVQLIFYRFTIYLKLLSCLGTAAVLLQWRPTLATVTRVVMFVIPVAILSFVLWIIQQSAYDGWALRTVQTSVTLHSTAYYALTGMLLLSAALLIPIRRWQTVRHLACVFAAVLVLTTLWTRLGVGMTPEPNDPEYRTVCEWARAETPRDAIFLVPPDETMFRLYARRAIVANFKSIPQLSEEFMEWERRLQHILNVDDLRMLPKQYDRIMGYLRNRYEFLPASQHEEVAALYHARYVVLAHELTKPHVGAILREGEAPAEPSSPDGNAGSAGASPSQVIAAPTAWTLVYTSPNKTYFVYDRGPQSSSPIGPSMKSP